ncbi:hypothetical protein MKEN_01148600 [Mycena kentingensis (nom. inval.)]|nr:hypothetical protein MKEN_01148600 [Mycena kentingensis (nom. inval.)]
MPAPNPDSGSASRAQPAQPDVKNSPRIHAVARRVLWYTSLVFAAGSVIQRPTFSFTVAAGALIPLIFAFVVPWTVTRKQKLALLKVVLVPPVAFVAGVDLLGLVVDAAGGIHDGPYSLNKYVAKTLGALFYLALMYTTQIVATRTVIWAGSVLLTAFGGEHKLGDDWATAIVGTLAPVPVLRKVKAAHIRQGVSTLTAVLLTLAQSAVTLLVVNPVDPSQPTWVSALFWTFAISTNLITTGVLVNIRPCLSGDASSADFGFSVLCLVFTFKAVISSAAGFMILDTRPWVSEEDDPRNGLSAVEDLLYDRRASTGWWSFSNTTTGGYPLFEAAFFGFFVDVVVFFLLLSQGQASMGTFVAPRLEQLACYGSLSPGEILEILRTSPKQRSLRRQ